MHNALEDFNLQDHCSDNL